VKSKRSLLAEALTAIGTCSVALGLALGTGLAMADVNPSDCCFADPAPCAVGKAACTTDGTCVLPATCPAATEVFPACNCK